jgi:hypothetical protein
MQIGCCIWHIRTILNRLAADKDCVVVGCTSCSRREIVKLEFDVCGCQDWTMHGPPCCLTTLIFSLTQQALSRRHSLLSNIHVGHRISVAFYYFLKISISRVRAQQQRDDVNK